MGKRKLHDEEREGGGRMAGEKLQKNASFIKTHVYWCKRN